MKVKLSKRSKIVAAVASALALLAVAGGGAYAYTAPSRAYKAAYAEYEALYATHSKIVADAEVLHSDCEANKDLVELVTPCAGFDSEYDALKPVQKLAALDGATRSQYKSAVLEVQAASSELDETNKVLSAAMDDAVKELQDQAVTYREGADAMVGEYETAAQLDREDAQSMEGQLDDDTLVQELISKIDALEAAIKEYRELGDDTYAAEISATLDKVRELAGEEDAAYSAVLAKLPIEATPDSIDAHTDSDSSILASRAATRAQAPRPASNTSSSSPSTSSAGSSSDSGSSSSYSGTSSSGSSSSGSGSSSSGSSSSGYTAGEWVPPSTWTEVDKDAFNEESDGSVSGCFETKSDGTSRQVPCDW